MTKIVRGALLVRKTGREIKKSDEEILHRREAFEAEVWSERVRLREGVLVAYFPISSPLKNP